MRRVALLALLALAAGCGGGHSAATTTGERATARCEARIDSSALAPALKAELKKSCAEGLSADGMASPDQVTRRATCRKLVLERVPEGPARRRGLAACAVNTRSP
jgi:hypothetical protein